MKSKSRIPKGYTEGTKDWQDQYDMLLDDGLTCMDCKHCERCCDIFGQKPYINSGRCQFYPNRFFPKASEVGKVVKLQTDNLTCFKCKQNTAKIIYEENKLYTVTCKCGCEYTFNHCSMHDAALHHNKMVELYGEIDQNRQLREILKLMITDFLYDGRCKCCTKYNRGIGNEDCSICVGIKDSKQNHFQWQHEDKLKALGIE